MGLWIDWKAVLPEVQPPDSSVLRFHSPIFLSSYSPIVLQSYCLTVLLSYSPIVLQSYCLTVLLSYSRPIAPCSFSPLKPLATRLRRRL
jgi:hypothetical protein